jgi:hypothetical protein
VTPGSIVNVWQRYANSRQLLWGAGLTNQYRSISGKEREKNHDQSRIPVSESYNAA